MAAADLDKALFLLCPTDDWARDVVSANPGYAKTHYQDEICFVFSPLQPSKSVARVATFGKDETNDIILPNIPARKYANHQMHFYFARSGELMLRDDTPRGSTHLILENASPEDEAKYSLSGSPRRRAIPRDPGMILLIVLGENTTFELRWHRINAKETNPLRMQAAMRVPLGMSPTSQEPVPAPKRYNLRRDYIPTTTPKNQNKVDKEIHEYTKLGEGTFGVVHKAVDLADGAIYAVKQLKAGARNHQWRLSLKREVEKVFDLRHDNIAALKHYQGFCIGGKFQLFFALYEGNLDELIPPHQCSRVWQPPAPPRFIPNLWRQMLSALEYLHSQKVIHLDIKPANILYMDSNFFLSDFGVSISFEETAVLGKAGTAFYAAPEVASDDQATVSASDIWSFAITMGCALGYWCSQDMQLSDAQWAAKLEGPPARAGDGPSARAEDGPSARAEDGPPAFDGDVPQMVARWHSRVLELVTRNLLPAAFAPMLAPPNSRADATKCLKMSLDDVTVRPANGILGTLSNQSADAIEWHIKAVDPNDMSYNIARGGWGYPPVGRQRRTAGRR